MNLIEQLGSPLRRPLPQSCLDLPLGMMLRLSFSLFVTDRSVLDRVFCTDRLMIQRVPRATFESSTGDPDRFDFMSQWLNAFVDQPAP